MDIHQGAQGHHFPRRVPDVKILDIFRLQAVGGVGLNVNLEYLVELIEKIDKGRTQVGLQRVKDITMGICSDCTLVRSMSR